MKRFFPAIAIVVMLSLSGCGPKDADIQQKITEKLNANTETSGASVSVADGVATLTGEVTSENGKTEAATIANDVKGVKSVINNITVSQAMSTTPVVVATDDALTTSVKDATKDHPGVNASITDGVITLTGEIDKASLPILMQKLNALQPKKIDNKLTIK